MTEGCCVFCLERLKIWTLFCTFFPPFNNCQTKILSVPTAIRHFHTALSTEKSRMMDGGKKEEAGPSHGGATWDKRKEEVEGDSEEDDHHQDPAAAATSFVPGPLLSLKDQIEKDKEDESLRRWKEKLLGCLESDLDGQMEPEVRFHSVGILSSDFGEINTPLPIKEEQSNSVLFTLREGSEYRLKLTFSVLHNIVSGLAYTNIVWKAGLQVDQSKGMLGTFAPQREPYIHMLEEETTPSGALARGTYTAKLKFMDDDKRCHLELNYSFEISKGR